MSAVRHLLRRSAGVLALVLAVAVLLGSLCPRGWFVCVHEDAVELVDGQHADAADCRDHACCHEDGCLDLAVSLVLDDQAVALPSWAALPAGDILAELPDLTIAAADAWWPCATAIDDPPPSPFVSHIRLLV